MGKSRSSSSSDNGGGITWDPVGECMVIAMGVRYANNTETLATTLVNLKRRTEGNHVNTPPTKKGSSQTKLASRFF